MSRIMPVCVSMPLIGVLHSELKSQDGKARPGETEHSHHIVRSACTATHVQERPA